MTELKLGPPPKSITIGMAGVGRLGVKKDLRWDGWGERAPAGVPRALMVGGLFEG